MDGGAWKAAVHGVAKSQTRLSDFPFTFHFHALQKDMATHSSVLDWRIPGTGEPGGLLSIWSHRVRHDCGDLAAAAPEETLQIAVKRKEAKSKGEKERYKHLNAEFQRKARKDEKAILMSNAKKQGWGG